MKYKRNQEKVEAFKFYVDAMPDWFMDLMSTNEAITYNCDHRRWGIDEAYCIIDVNYKEKMCVLGGEYIIKDENGEIHTSNSETFHKKYEKLDEDKNEEQ